MQMFMVKLFEKKLGAEQENEIKQLLSNYFAEKIDQEIDEIWNERNLSQKDLDHALDAHKRTKY
jgi:hypothetical protein